MASKFVTSRPWLYVTLEDEIELKRCLGCGYDRHVFRSVEIHR